MLNRRLTTAHRLYNTDQNSAVRTAPHITPTIDLTRHFTAQRPHFRQVTPAMSRERYCQLVETQLSRHKLPAADKAVLLASIRSEQITEILRRLVGSASASSRKGSHRPYAAHKQRPGSRPNIRSRVNGHCRRFSASMDRFRGYQYCLGDCSPWEVVITESPRWRRGSYWPCAAGLAEPASVGAAGDKGF